MINSKTAPCIRYGLKPLLIISSLATALLLLVLPAAVLAQSPDPPYTGPEKCAQCHSAETEAWKDSPHANAIVDIDEAQITACQKDVTTEGCECLSCHTTDFDPGQGTFVHAGVSCEACHGPYVEDHPKNGVMQLNVDSSICSDCHTQTHQEWQNSLHADVGVQCISCHLSHSQDFRITDETICSACHRELFEDFSHTTHSSQHVTCTDCHLSQPPAGSTGSNVAPGHDFSFAAEACVNCHEQPQIQKNLERTILEAVAMGVQPDCPEEVITRLEVAEESNKSLKTLSLTGLGMGVGIGGMLGIVALLVFGYISQAKGRKHHE